VQIGRFITFLKDKELYEDAIIIVTGDTGQAFYEHAVACHAGPLFNEVIVVPLIIKTPRSRLKGMSEEFVSHVDIASTISHLLNLKSHPSFQGLNLFSRNDLSQRPIFSLAQMNAKQEMVIFGDWKYRYDQRRRRKYLHNVVDDPGEKSNVFSTEPDIAENLSRHLTAWHDMQRGYYNSPEQYQVWYPPKIMPSRLGDDVSGVAAEFE
jgi:arylsulfatase A-like enzyme